MALKLKYTDPYGCEHPEAYWRMVAWTFNVAQMAARVEFLIYHDEKSRRSGKAAFPQALGFNLVAAPENMPEGFPTLEEVLAALDEGKGVRPFLYVVAKMLPDLEGAEDC